jgi:histidyl-tRNA synthetase
LYKATRGTFDILPEDQPFWEFVKDKARNISELYGYKRIDTPIFEDSSLFVRSIGKGTDIVEKEMYSFQDQGGTTLTLRPEGTAPVCRSYLEHGMHSQLQPVKLYYITPIFRYERPQAGRYRQHKQFGFEAIGESDPALDAEVIEMVWNFFKSVGLLSLKLKLNSIGCPNCRSKYVEALKEYYSPKIETLCGDCQKRFLRNPLRLLDCKKERCAEVAKEAPRSVDFLCEECDSHYCSLKKYLQLLEIPLEEDHCLVRGLDYYTKTVFEIQPLEEKGAQSALGGGGRYDRLIEELGGKPTPAVGFATGIERIILNLKKQNIAVPSSSSTQVFIIYIGENVKEEAIKLSSRLRKEGIPSLISFGQKSLKTQMRYANSKGARFALIVGEDELKNGAVTFKDMVDGKQEQISLKDCPKIVSKSVFHKEV